MPTSWWEWILFVVMCIVEFGVVFTISWLIVIKHWTSLEVFQAAWGLIAHRWRSIPAPQPDYVKIDQLERECEIGPYAWMPTADVGGRSRVKDLERAKPSKRVVAGWHGEGSSKPLEPLDDLIRNYVGPPLDHYDPDIVTRNDD